MGFAITSISTYGQNIFHFGQTLPENSHCGILTTQRASAFGLCALGVASRWGARDLMVLVTVFSVDVEHGVLPSDKIDADLPLNFHPAAIRGPAFSDTPNGALVATGGNA